MRQLGGDDSRASASPARTARATRREAAPVRPRCSPRVRPARALARAARPITHPELHSPGPLRRSLGCANAAPFSRPGALDLGRPPECAPRQRSDSSRRRWLARPPSSVEEPSRYLVLKNSRGLAIVSIDDWTRPEREYQWKPGHSAMELARSWLRWGKCECPSELGALLDAHAVTRGWQFAEGCPEFVTTLPERGEGRIHGAGGPLTLCIEAKVDEPFGESIGETIARARGTNPRSRAPARPRAFAHAALGEVCDPENRQWRDLRYQLLTACAGTALQAARDGRGLLCW